MQARSRGFERYVLQNAKILTGINWLVSPLLVSAIPLVIYFEPGDVFFRQFWAYKVAETFSPLLGALVGANIFSMEWDLKTSECWLAKFQSRRLLQGLRFLIISAAILVLLIYLLALINVFYVRVNIFEGIMTIFPPSILLANLGALSGLISQNTIVAYLVPILYWFMDFTTRGKFTGIFYLFSRSVSGCYSNCEPAAGDLSWLQDKVAVLLLACCLAGLSLILLSSYEQLRRN